MPSNNVSITQALGLATDSNQLTLPVGAMSEASNVVIRRDNTVQSRRGMKLYGNSMTSKAKQLLIYKERIIRHYDTKLEFDDGSGSFSAFTGSFTEPSSIQKIKSVESNNNFYFTTASGVKKISALTTDDITTSTAITDAGGVKAIDFNVRTTITTGDQSSILPVDTAVAYRHVWALKDNNSNLVIGTPSPSTTVANYFSSSLVKDVVRLCLQLDTFVLTASAALDDTFTTATPHGYNNGDKIVFTDLGTTVGTGLALITEYYIINTASLTFKISTTLGGSALDITTAGTVTFSRLSDGNYAQTISNSLNATSDGAEIKLALNSLATKLDEDIANFTNASAITVNTIAVVNGVVTVTFSASVAGYFTTGSYVYMKNFSNNDGKTFDGIYQITNSPSTTITFLDTNITGTFGVTTVAVQGGEFRKIYNTAVDEVNTFEIIDSPATKPQLESVSTVLQDIISKIKNYSPVGVIGVGNKSKVSSLLTTSSKVFIDISIPDEVIDAYNAGIYYFYQVYRTKLSFGDPGSIDLDSYITQGAPGDEMFLIEESYPSQDQISAKRITIEDLTPDDLLGAALYTNELTGDGINQANEKPPISQDIAKFKNHTFYANTSTRFKQTFNLISVDNLNAEVGSGSPKFVLTKDDGTSTAYSFTLGVREKRKITFTASSLVSSASASSYFTLYPANSNSTLVDSFNPTKYVVWIQKGSSIQPSTGSAEADYTGQEVVYIQVTLQPNDYVSGVPSTDDPLVARRVLNYLQQYADLFTSTVSSNELTIENNDYGYSANSAIGFTGIVAAQITEGKGEKVSNLEVLLYPSTESKALAIDQTARSLVKIINKNTNEKLYGYYISNSTTIPGTFLLENKDLDGPQFFASLVTTNLDSLSGNDFSPTLQPEANLIAQNTGSDTIKIRRVTGSNLVNSDFQIGDQIVLFGTAFDDVVTILNNNVNSGDVSTATGLEIKLDKDVTGSFSGAIIRTSQVEAADNEIKSHRIYYSKVNQPEAVPSLNYFDVGASDQQITRIIPLRDSLFIFKDDGLYRLSGETAPFSVSLFDENTTLIAPDTAQTVNNLIYAWTDQGIQSISETGAELISRQIYTDLIRLSSSQFSNFKSITWGVGYDSDKSYLVFTNSEIDDTVPTIAYRYDTGTQTWTTFDVSATCGIINPVDDKLYWGAGDVNYLEIERKSLDRTDYADRETVQSIALNQYNSGVLKVSDTSLFTVGDVIKQDQTLTVYTFNSLLKKLDIDPTLTDGDYYSTLVASSGNNMRLKLEALATKLEADATPGYVTDIGQKTGTITSISIANPTILTSANHGLKTGRYITISGSNSTSSIDGKYQITRIDSNTFSIPVNVLNAGTNNPTWSTDITDVDDIQACYNIIISDLNSDSQVGFSTYNTISGTTTFETIVDSINKSTSELTLHNNLQFVVGPYTIYKAIDCSFTYSPITMDDPLNYKHLRESTMMFANKAFTRASLGFSTDLFPAFSTVNFEGDGNGIFGQSNSFGSNFFGGGSNGAPFRTYVPRQAQRCRYIQVKFNHKTAREIFSVYGITLTGRTGLSPRAYRR